MAVPAFPESHVRTALIGTPRRDFGKTWATACRLAGYTRMLRHDFPAHGRAEHRAGQRLALGRHEDHRPQDRTEAIYRPYAIVSPADLKRAPAHLAEHRPGTIFGHIAASTLPRGQATGLDSRGVSNCLRCQAIAG